MLGLTNTMSIFQYVFESMVNMKCFQIQDEYEWLTGKQPERIVYASDRMTIYLQHAKEDILNQNAYVCTCSHDSTLQSKLGKSMRQGGETGRRMFKAWKERGIMGNWRTLDEPAG